MRGAVSPSACMLTPSLQPFRIFQLCIFEHALTLCFSQNLCPAGAAAGHSAGRSGGSDTGGSPRSRAEDTAVPADSTRCQQGPRERLTGASCVVGPSQVRPAVVRWTMLNLWCKSGSIDPACTPYILALRSMHNPGMAVFGL